MAPDVLYLLDANVLITAHRDYYSVQRVPEFWEWLRHHAEAGRVKVPAEILDEVTRGRPRKGMDDLLHWVNKPNVKRSLLLDEEPDSFLLQQVIEVGYAPDLREDELPKLGRDPFLIAYALLDPSRRRIVTNEVSRPRQRRANRKIPDVAKRLGIQTLTPFQFFRQLDFRTAWRE